MKQIQYFEIFKQALLTSWKNKFLWVFGFLVLLGSFSANFEWMTDKKDNTQYSNATSEFFQKNPYVFLGVIMGMLVLLIIFFLLRLIGSAALIKSANNIPVYSQSKIKNILSEVKKYVWRLFLLEILIGFSLAIILIIMIVPTVFLFVLKSYVLAVIMLLAAVAIGVFLFVITYYLKKFSYFYIVLSDMKIKTALEFAYESFRKNIKESLLMGCIAIALNMAVVVAILFFILISVIVLVILSIPFDLIAYFLFAKTGIIVILAIAAFAVIVVLLILLSWYFSLAQIMWLLFFQQISAEQKKEKNAAESFKAENEIPNPEVV